jgi:hypothetical protein
MTSPFIAAVFLNLQSANVIALMQVKPAWGIFTGLVALLVFLFLAIAGYKLLAANRGALPLSLRETAGELPRQLHPRQIKLILLVLSLLIGFSIFWLWRMPQ